jgi:hypothetical protein
MILVSLNYDQTGFQSHHLCVNLGHDRPHGSAFLDFRILAVRTGTNAPRSRQHSARKLQRTLNRIEARLLANPTKRTRTSACKENSHAGLALVVLSDR